MAWLESYGCATAAGDSPASLYGALIAGKDFSAPFSKNSSVKALEFQNRGDGSVFDILIDKLLISYKGVNPHLRRHEKFGVILSSTKGRSDDLVWGELDPWVQSDPLTPILTEFLKRCELIPARSVCVSNACSSSLAAISLAEKWMQQDCSQVLIVAADAVTPFVVRGFQALKLISSEGSKPFSGDRSGFFLGDGAACLLLSRERGCSNLMLHKVGLDSEGSAVTRPSTSGESLRRAALRIPRLLDLKPEILIAHGTGTRINDETEDLAFSALFPEEHRPVITCTKWCIGHTLAVSGALDLIAAVESLRAQKIFRLMTTDLADAKFLGRYLTKDARTPEKFSRVMISSLGFGGMHASALVELVT